MSTFDPYLSSLVKPDDVKSHLYNYMLNRLGVGPKAPQVPVPDTPYKGTSGNFVGTDTSKVGGNNRNIDLERPDLHSNYVGLDPDTQNVVEHDGQAYIIDKDQRLVGDQVLSKDTPVFGQGKARVGRGLLDLITLNKWDFDKRNTATNISEAQQTRPKSPAELERDRDLALEGHDDRKKDKALDRAMKTAENQAAVDLNYMKQMYPIAQAAAWDATKRGIYGDKYSASAAQRRMAEAAGAEAQMMTGIANQANAAANLRGRYTGKNLSFG